MGKRTTIYLSPPLAAALDGIESGSQSRRLSTIADRYDEIIRRSRIGKRFSERQMNALRDCCSGTLFEPPGLIDGAVRANFEDSLLDGLAEKWEIDTAETIEILRGLTFSDQVALVEEIESFRSSA